MTISMKGIVLLVVVQISVVLCASTGKPSDKDLEGPFTGIPADVVQDGTVVQLGSIISKGLFSGISAGVVQDGTVVQVEKIIPSDTSKILEKQTVVQDGTGVQLSATIPSKLKFDFDDIDIDIDPDKFKPDDIDVDIDPDKFKPDVSVIDGYNTRAALGAFAIAAIVISVISVVSFFNGCVIYYMCKKDTRRGLVVNSSGGQTSEMPQPSISQPGFVQPMQQYPPPPYGQN